MSRPRIPRCVKFHPTITIFKPQGVPVSEIEEVTLLPEEIEALKLSDGDGLQQAVACVQLKVSQPTFARILASARKKVTRALVGGRAIRLGTTDEENCD